MAYQQEHLDRVFHALSDPTRRAVVRTLCRGDAAVTQLAAPFDMALPTFMKHLAVLEECGLVRSRKEGRVRTCRLSRRPLQAAETWMNEQRALWEKRFDQLENVLEEMKAEDIHRDAKEKK